jgi:hypothetical protein
MASILSAGTTSGTALNMSGDTSGVLQLATNGTTTALTLDASQNATFAGTLTTTGITNSGVATATRFNPTGSSVTGNGMYLPAANSLGLSTNGTNAVYIDSSQNVGINQTSPTVISTAKQLAIKAPTNGDALFVSQNSNGLTTFIAGYYGVTAGPDKPVVGSYSNDPVAFITNNTERMRIDSSGNLLVGQTSQSNKEKFGVSQSNSTSEVAYLNATPGDYGYDVIKLRCARGSATTEYNFINCLQVSTVVFRVQANGNTQNTNNSYGSLSDIKLKENIVDATPKLADLMQVKVRNYNLKSDPTHKQLGVIAQELEQVFPAMVEESPDKDDEGNDLGTTTKGVKYSVFVPMLIKAMQEQQATITAQAETINALTARIVAIESK